MKRLVSAMLGVLIVCSPTLSIEPNEELEATPCFEFSELGPAKPIPYFCQIVDGIDPVDQSVPPESDAGERTAIYAASGLWRELVHMNVVFGVALMW